MRADQRRTREGRGERVCRAGEPRADNAVVAQPGLQLDGSPHPGLRIDQEIAAVSAADIATDAKDVPAEKRPGPEEGRCFQPVLVEHDTGQAQPPQTPAEDHRGGHADQTDR